MSLPHHQLSAALKRKCLSLDEKIVILDYANEHPKMGCWKIAEHFSVGKTAVSNILKDRKNLQKDFKFFKGNYKKHRHGKYMLSMKFCTIGMESARVQTYILTGPYFKKKLWRSKEDWTNKSLLGLQL